tara:strand:+ start:1556 stop:1891 length:336 start_codon:yes stop_codon:yes gene_type:complete
LKRREKEIHVINKQDIVLAEFVSNFEESRGHIRNVFRDHDEDHNNLLSANEFCEAMTGANFNLKPDDANELTKYFFGNDINAYSGSDEMTFATFARKVSVLQMLPRMRGEI